MLNHAAITRAYQSEPSGTPSAGSIAVVPGQLANARVDQADATIGQAYHDAAREQPWGW